MAALKVKQSLIKMKTAKRETLKIAEHLGHHLTPFTPYGYKEFAYCENPDCKARLIVEGDRAEGYAKTSIHSSPLATVSANQFLSFRHRRHHFLQQSFDFIP